MLFTFTNNYLSSIQKGIQSLHVTSELFVKYADPAGDHSCREMAAGRVLWHWAKKIKAAVVLNGINSGTLLSIQCMLDKKENPYPWVDFHEDQVSLGGALTCVGIVLPEKIFSRPRRHHYDTVKEYNAEMVKHCRRFKLTEFDKNMICLIDQYQLAN